MFESIKLFPPYLIFLTLVFVIIPAVLSFFIRIALYKYLQDSAQKVQRLITGQSRGRQPAIVYKLEARFKQASNQLESVNTSALIEGIYSEEEFSFFSQSLRCEQWDYFSKILPNLLLAFGLLGTFLGITLNLTNISDIIHQGSVDNSNLVQNLQAPLQSMGIAFITSLIALLFSSALTIINLRCNTSFAKNRLMSSLEDYLDNIFHPSVEGYSRFDKAVNQMVDQQNEFLTRFHENVTKAVESSLGRVAQQIAEGNKESASLAKQVYERLTETSGTLARGADTFHQTSLRLAEQVNKLSQIVQHENFLEYSKLLQKSATVFKEASEKIEDSKFSDKLVEATINSEKTQQQLSDATAKLTQLTQSLQLTTEAISNSAQKMIDFGNNISQSNEQSLHLLESTKQYFETDTTTVKELRDYLIKSLLSQTDNHEQVLLQLKAVVEASHQGFTNLQSNSQNNLGNLGDKLSKVILQESNRYSHNIQIIAEEIQKSTRAIREIETLLAQESLKAQMQIDTNGNQVNNYFS